MTSFCIIVNAMGQKTSLLPDLQRTVSTFLSLFPLEEDYSNDPCGFHTYS